jgi:hypothetical protein
MSASARVLSPEIPLHSLGAGATGPLVVRQRRPSRTMYAPRTPLYQLGYYELAGLGTGAQVVAATAPIAAVATSATISAAAAGSGAAWGAAAGPIGAAAGAIVGLIAGFMAGHELRKKQAKNENASVNLGVPAFDQGLTKLQQAYKAGQISPTDVQQGVSVLLQNFWQEVAPNIQPGRNGCNNGSSCPIDTSAQGRQPCTGNIGAACCVGCFPLTESVTGPTGVLAALAGQSASNKGPYVAEMMAIGASKYGTSYRAPYTLDFTPPPVSTTSVTSALSSITGGSGGSLMPLLLIGAALYMVSR